MMILHCCRDKCLDFLVIYRYNDIKIGIGRKR